MGSRQDQYNHILAGGLSAAVTRFLTQPLDVLKVRFQLQLEPLGLGSDTGLSKYKSLPHAVKQIFHDEGITAFWKGHVPGQLLSIMFGIVQFWSYEELTLIGKNNIYLKDHSNTYTFISGGIAGGLAIISTTPFDVIRTRLIAQDKNRVYRNIPMAVIHIVRNEGFVNLYRGLVPSVLHMMPLMGTNFLIYDLLGDVAKTALKVEERNKLPSIVLLSIGAFAGSISKALFYPFDLIKRRLQVQGFDKHRTTFGRNMTCRSLIECCRITVADEGYRGFFKGFAPTLLKSAAQTSLHFAFYDKILRLIL